MTIKTGTTDNDGGGSNPKPGAAADPKTSQILEDIAQTRSEMSGTLGELQQKLSPAALKEKAAEKVDEAKNVVRDATIGKVEAVADTVRETAGDVQDSVMRGGRSTLQFIKDNPIPLALTGIGLTWLLMGARRDSVVRYPRQFREPLDPFDAEDRYLDEREPARRRSGRRGAAQRLQRGVASVTHSVEGKAQELTDSASQLARQAQESFQNATRDVGDRASRLADELRTRGDHARIRAQQAYQDNPLVVGAAVAVAGTALGLALPLTRREEELLASARGQLVRGAQDFARGALDKVQDAAKHVGGDGG
jgi:ElaB/YqjD/DUF883 family membrane-anchored ribosome-binding protein